ncbi:histone-lysine N-methyltransferase SETMAR [Nephila pilipes]|uniref:Histone-lysine N-methyltransferase SETMAR n=1 Tax=Nephila pilipes TaxID=299642 RepID=A0A8X6UCE4_NEPPI|nr:histone-lysine N-methyltransferase SETMAR [Nephila pilipes]
MIAESLNMSVGSVFTIMTEDLKKKKLCARFVPHTLTTEQKERRIASSEDLIAAADEDPNFLKTIVTGDESWCLEYDPETKRQSSEWTSPGKGRPMKVRASKSKTKTMLLVFFDSRGIIHHEFLRQGSTVTGAFYKDVLHRLLKRMRRELLSNYAYCPACSSMWIEADCMNSLPLPHHTPGVLSRADRLGPHSVRGRLSRWCVWSS